MARKLVISLLAGVAVTILLAALNLHRSGLDPPTRLFLFSKPDPNYALQTEPITIRHVVTSVSILFPDWEVVSLSLSPLSRHSKNYTCHFPNSLKSRAQFRDSALRCQLPPRLRRRPPFPQPKITDSAVAAPPEVDFPAPDLLRWDRLVYASLTTDYDVIVFAKGINRRQGSYGEPNEFLCVFDNAFRTPVTVSAQEVFRCKLPDANAVFPSVKAGLRALSSVKVSLQHAASGNAVLSSVAYYTPRRMIAEPSTKSLLCACTMVYNAAKFLREWVIYHSSIGVERFIIYDNNSDDELQFVVDDLVLGGYDVTAFLWIWPKTQEAGFSHCATSANDTCKWMMYTDVDEFVYSPLWMGSPNPSTNMLPSMLPKSEMKIGQLTINCYEFGPSDQKYNPVMGVTQGYNYRRQVENRHKSIVFLDAIDESLLNVIHHFKLKENYESRRLGKDELLVNHYKYQAWPEFRIKFRRRVSAYVADWTKEVNLASKDRAPGLGYSAVEPEGWAQKFCEVSDDRLKNLTKKWFMKSSSRGYKMAWQRNTGTLA